MRPLSPKERHSLLEGPAAPPPPGQLSNLDGPQPMLIIGQVILYIFGISASICFMMHAYTRAFTVRQFRLSDCILVLAWALYVAYVGIAFLTNAVAPCVDQWDQRLRDFISMLYYNYIGTIIYCLSVFVVKLSILQKFLEIFSLQHDYFFWSCHCLIWVNLVFYLAMIFLEVFACKPISGAWDVLIREGSCAINMRLLNVVGGSVNSVSDLIILTLPLTRIWRLHVPLRKKLAISAVFSFGLLSCASAIVRLSYAVILFNTTNNISRFIWMSGLWTIAEIGCGIIAGCIPSLPKFIQSRRTRIAAEITHAHAPFGGMIMLPVSSWPGSGRRWKAPDLYPLTSFANDIGRWERACLEPDRVLVPSGVASLHQATPPRVRT
ncbi:hypothetical protein BJY01DRAFT_259365 [Aspergillus pseudoustus]|uniref:Rhodopsin domain-containing protein n=1 Tax=Aspergillus pseudoustus TaxID=1810923 RepID=A0ABR4J4U1_9EURO